MKLVSQLYTYIIDIYIIYVIDCFDGNCISDNWFSVHNFKNKRCVRIKKDTIKKITFNITRRNSFLKSGTSNIITLRKYSSYT